MLGSDNVDKIGTILCVPWVDTYVMVGGRGEKDPGKPFFFLLPRPPRTKAADFLPQ